jgi:hypothetical protein
MVQRQRFEDLREGIGLVADRARKNCRFNCGRRAGAARSPGPGFRPRPRRWRGYAHRTGREILYSSAKPLPPWICTALSAAAPATRAASSFAMPASRSQRRPLSFFPGGVIADLARDHDLRRHHGDLVGGAGKFDQLLAPPWAWPSISRFGMGEKMVLRGVSIPTNAEQVRFLKLT